MADHTCQGQRETDGKNCSRPLAEPGYCYQHADQAERAELDEDLEALTVKQRRFVKEYLVDRVGVQAARRAGYEGSYSTLCAIASENLRKPKIWEPIERRLERDGMSYTEILARLSSMGRGSMQPFVRVRDDDRIEIDLSSEAAELNMGLVRKLKVKTKRFEDDEEVILEQTVELELHDAKDALKTLLKAHGKLNDQVEHSVDTASADTIAKLLGVNLEGIHGDDG